MKLVWKRRAAGERVDEVSLRPATGLFLAHVDVCLPPVRVHHLEGGEKNSAEGSDVGFIS